MSDTPPPVPPVPSPDGSTPPPVPPVPPDSSAQSGVPAPTPYPAYGEPAPAGYAPPTNTMAIVAMVLSLVGVVTGITAIVGAILGHVALGQIKRTGESGRPFALTAVIVGWVITGLGLLIVIGFIVFYVLLFAAVGTAGVYSGS